MDVAKLGANIINSSDINKTRRPDPVNKDGPMDVAAYLGALQKKFPDYKVGAGTVTRNNIPSGRLTMTIAPNILKAMAEDPDVAAKYEEFLADYERTAPQFERMQAAQGHETVARGVFINSDGTTGCYIVGQPADGGGRRTEMSPLDEMLKKVVERRAAQAEQQKKLQEARQAKREAEETRTEKAGEENGASVDIKIRARIDHWA